MSWRINPNLFREKEITRTKPRVLAAGLLSSLVVAMANAGLAGDFKPASVSPDYTVVKVLNQDQFEGNWKQFKGDLKKSGASLPTMTCWSSRAITINSRESCKNDMAIKKNRS